MGRKRANDKQKTDGAVHRPSWVHRNAIASCENEAEYEALVRDHSRLYVPWAEHVGQLRKARRLHIYEIAKGCGLADATVSTFLKKIPTKREYVIMLAAMLGMDVEQTDHLLTRWAKFQGLYAKNPEDAIWIYLLSKGGCDRPAEQFKAYHAVYQKELKNNRGGTSHRHTFLVKQEIAESAKRSAASAAEDDDAFIQMIRSQIPEFQAGYDKLMRYLEQQMEDARLEYGSPNEMFADNDYFRSNYYEKMRAFRKNRVLPSRTFLIVLGLRLNMDPKSIDQLLEMAGMGPMCAKDRLEGSVVFFLEELYCSCPSVFFNFKRLGTDAVYYDLHENSSDAGLIRRSDDGEGNDETLSDYIKRRMNESGISYEGDEAERAKEFLRML